MKGKHLLYRLVAIISFATSSLSAQVGVIPLEGDSGDYMRHIIANSLASEGIKVVDFQEIDLNLTNQIIPKAAIKELGAKLGVYTFIGGSIEFFPQNKTEKSPDEAIVRAVIEIIDAKSQQTKSLPEVWMSGVDYPSAIQGAYYLAQPNLLDSLDIKPDDIVGLILHLLGRWFGEYINLYMLLPILGTCCIGLGIWIIAYKCNILDINQQSIHVIQNLSSKYEERIRNPVYSEVVATLAENFHKHFEDYFGHSNLSAKEIERIYLSCIASRNILFRYRAMFHFRRISKYLSKRFLRGINEHQSWYIYQELTKVLREAGIEKPLLEVRKCELK